MAIKSNEATINRPDGDRVLDAATVLVDIPARINEIKAEKAWKESDRNSITIFKSGGHTLVLTALHKDAVMQNNTTDALLTLHVLEGNVHVTVGDDATAASSGQLVAIHPGILYSIQAATDAVFLLSTHFNH